MKRLWVLLLLMTAAAGAQAPADSAHPPARSIFDQADLWIAAGFVGGTAAMFPLDRQIAGAVRDSALVANRSLAETAKVFGFTGSYAPFIVGAGLYGIGRLADKPRLAHLAVHGGEAVLVGLVVTGVLKTTLGRARPHVTSAEEPHRFRLLEGFRSDDWQSFPSGHSTTIFATVSAATAELSAWYPRSKWVIGSVLYGGAAIVGLSRMYENKHWASDVVMGAAIGTFAGIKTVRFAHSREGHWADRWFLGGDARDDDGAHAGARSAQLRIVPGAGGVTLVFSSRW